MGGQGECQACTNIGARTPSVLTKILYSFFAKVVAIMFPNVMPKGSTSIYLGPRIRILNSVLGFISLYSEVMQSRHLVAWLWTRLSNQNRISSNKQKKIQTYRKDVKITTLVNQMLCFRMFYSIGSLSTLLRIFFFCFTFWSGFQNKSKEVFKTKYNKANNILISPKKNL